MDNRPVGIFDSGLGGLTAVSALRELLPDENIIYFGDTARMPYGTKSVLQLRCMAQQDMELLEARNVKAILAACGTVSSTASDILAAFRLKVFNVVDAAVEAVAKTEGNAPIGVIATDASIKSGVFKRKIEALCPDREVIALPCQDFVKLIESGHTGEDDIEVIKSVEGYLRPMKEKGVAALLLGCTHFGYLSAPISAYLGENVRLVSASHCAALSMRDYLVSHGMTGGGGSTQYITSGDKAQFAELASRLLGESVEDKTAEIDFMEV